MSDLADIMSPPAYFAEQNCEDSEENVKMTVHYVTRRFEFNSEVKDANKQSPPIGGDAHVPSATDAPGSSNFRIVIYKIKDRGAFYTQPVPIYDIEADGETMKFYICDETDDASELSSAHSSKTELYAPFAVFHINSSILDFYGVNVKAPKQTEINVGDDDDCGTSLQETMFEELAKINAVEYVHQARNEKNTAAAATADRCYGASVGGLAAPPGEKGLLPPPTQTSASADAAATSELKCRLYNQRPPLFSERIRLSSRRQSVDTDTSMLCFFFDKVLTVIMLNFGLSNGLVSVDGERFAYIQESTVPPYDSDIKINLDMMDALLNKDQKQESFENVCLRTVLSHLRCNRADFVHLIISLFFVTPLVNNVLSHGPLARKNFFLRFCPSYQTALILISLAILILVNVKRIENLFF